MLGRNTIKRQAVDNWLITIKLLRVSALYSKKMMHTIILPVMNINPKQKQYEIVVLFLQMAYITQKNNFSLKASSHKVRTKHTYTTL